MKFLNTGSEVAGISSDLVQRDEAVVAIERSVLQSLGHDCGRDLLELHGKAENRLLVPSGLAAIDIDQENALDEIEDAQVGGVASLLCCNDGFFDVAAVFVRHLGAIHVGAIDGKAGDDFA